MKTAIATTTIGSLSAFLGEYISNIKCFGHENDVTIYIAGDRKSSEICADEILRFKGENVNIRFLSIEWQHDYLQKFHGLDEIIPENSDNRRNVAYLLALDEGAEVVISVDDDNFPDRHYDFVGEHSVVGTIASTSEASGPNNWFNLLSLLELTHECYPRGFPYKYRSESCGSVTNRATTEVAINVGLWTGEPDVDAVTRLAFGPKSNGWPGPSLLLSNASFSPINTQNTAVSREAMTAYYYVRMGATLKGMTLDRFGDILSGYFVELCVKATGKGIRLGSPLTEHRRNVHNNFVDLHNELAGIMVIEDLATLFETVRLPATSIYDAYTCLSHELEDFTSCQEGFVWDGDTRSYFRQIARNMRVWADVVNAMGS